MVDESDEQIPYIVITKQPKRSLVFKSANEGLSQKILGENSTENHVEYPEIEIVGLTRVAYVVAYCAEKIQPYKIHPHSLLFNANHQDLNFAGVVRGIIYPDQPRFKLIDLRLQCVTAGRAAEILQNRKSLLRQLFRLPFWESVNDGVTDLNTFRLAFQVFIQDPITKRYSSLKPAISHSIHNKGTNSPLTIDYARSRYGSIASVFGGTRIVILCSHVHENDIRVRFYEEDKGEVVWDADADPFFTQVIDTRCVNVRTPVYKNIYAAEPVNIFIQLIRPSDDEKSKPVSFQLHNAYSKTCSAE